MCNEFIQGLICIPICQIYLYSGFWTSNPWNNAVYEKFPLCKVSVG